MRPLFDGILALSMALVLGGVRRFDGQRGIAPWMWGVIVAAATIPPIVTLVFGTAQIALTMWSLVGPAVHLPSACRLSAIRRPTGRLGRGGSPGRC